MSRQRMREQGDDGKQAQEGRGHAGDGQVSPLPLSFDTEIRADFLQRDFDLPPLDKSSHNLSGRERQSRRQQHLGTEFILGIANQYPADGRNKDNSAIFIRV